MDTSDDRHSIERRARRRVGLKIGFYVHALVFVLVNLGLYAMNATIGSGHRWPLFPLWGRPTAPLAREMIAGGLRARLTCVDPRNLDARFAGRDFDEGLLAELPPTVDPCGERGEFHTFAYDGPMFARPIPIRSGKVVTRDGFVFADLVPA